MATSTKAASAVVIVGGGLAGCAAALALARAGRSVTLLEARSRLGGRVGSYTDQQTGQAVDYCQHVGMGCCTNLRQLIRWLEQEDDWAIEDQLFFYGPQSHQRRTLRGLPFLPAPLHLSSWLLQWPGLALGERWNIARAMLAIDRLQLSGPQTDLLDQQSAHQWLVAQKQSSNAIGRFWSTIIVSALGEELERVSLLAVAKVFQDGFLRDRSAYHLLIPRKSLQQLLGQQMLTALNQAGVTVKMNQAVTGIQWQGDQPNRLTTNQETIDLSASRLIIAVPWHIFPIITNDPSCPESLKQAAGDAEQLTSSPISGVHTWWDRPWLPTRHAVLVGRLCQWIFPKADADLRDETHNKSHNESASQHYYQIVISASRSLPRGDPAASEQMILSDLVELFPEARTARLLRAKVVTDPQAVFSVRPGVDRYRPPSGSTIGGVVLAGDWIRTGWPATMESAILSGFQAAESVLRTT